MNLDFRATLQVLLIILTMSLVVVCIGMAFDLTTINQEKIETILMVLGCGSGICMLSLGLTYLE